MKASFFAASLRLPCLLALASAMLPQFAAAQSYQSVYAFPTAASPGRDLVRGPDDLLYGCTDASPGTIYRLTPATSTVQTLATFSDPVGVSPRGSLCFASDGKCYGIAAAGGASNNGTIFRFDLGTNAVTALFSFSGLDGATPEGGLVEGPEGWLYGITRQGGSSKTGTDPGKGTVFQFNPTTTQFKTIHHFSGLNGASPRAALCKASDGRLYGTFSESVASATTTAFGGIFVLLPTKTTAPAQTARISASYYFKNTLGKALNGSAPRGRLIEASTGTLYGTCSTGGANNQGTIFTFGTASKTINLIASFKGYTNTLAAYTGATPLAGLTLGPDGTLYGTCYEGGSSLANTGTVFRYTPSTKVLARIHDFATSADFTFPRTAFALAADSALYGAAEHGLYRILLGGRLPLGNAPTASLITSTGAKLTSTITPAALSPTGGMNTAPAPLRSPSAPPTKSSGMACCPSPPASISPACCRTPPTTTASSPPILRAPPTASPRPSPRPTPRRRPTPITSASPGPPPSMSSPTTPMPTTTPSPSPRSPSPNTAPSPSLAATSLTRPGPAHPRATASPTPSPTDSKEPPPPLSAPTSLTRQMPTTNTSSGRGRSSATRSPSIPS